VNDVCLVCKKPVIDKCHVRTRGAGGSDESWNIMYLCREHHTEQHKIGIVTFANKYPVVMYDLNQKGWVFEFTNGKVYMYNEKTKEH